MYRYVKRPEYVEAFKYHHEVLPPDWFIAARVVGRIRTVAVPEDNFYYVVIATRETPFDPAYEGDYVVYDLCTKEIFPMPEDKFNETYMEVKEDGK